MAATLSKRSGRAHGYDSFTLADPYALFLSQLSAYRALVCDHPNHAHTSSTRIVLDLLDAQKPLWDQLETDSAVAVSHASEEHKLANLIGSVNRAVGHALITAQIDINTAESGLSEVLGSSEQLRAIFERHRLPRWTNSERDALEAAIKVGERKQPCELFVTACSQLWTQHKRYDKFYLDNYEKNGTYKRSAKAVRALFHAFAGLCDDFQERMNDLPRVELLTLARAFNAIAAIAEGSVHVALLSNIRVNALEWVELKRETLALLLDDARQLLDAARDANAALASAGGDEIDLEDLEEVVEAASDVAQKESAEQSESSEECSIRKRATRFVRVLRA